MGNSYKDTSYVVLRNYEHSYADFYLAGKYKEIKFKIAAHNDMSEKEKDKIQLFKNKTGESSFEADAFWESPYIDRLTKVDEYSIDVTGIDYLKVAITWDGRLLYSETSHILLIDAVLLY